MPNTDNPLLAPWTSALGLPPFDLLKPEHFRPAFDAEMKAQIAAIDKIVGSKEAPTFDNTIVALELSGLGLDQVAAVFFHLATADTNDALQAVERDMAPLLARHGNAISLNEPLFRRIEAVWKAREKLDPEQKRVVERYHTNFVRAGAALDAAGKKRLAAITERLAEIGTQFGQNVLADESGFMLVLEGEADLAGLPESRRCGRGGSGERARACRASTSSRCRARRSSRSCNSRPGATSARRRSTRGSSAASSAARPTTARSSPK